MNIKQELLKQHSRKQAERIARYAAKGKKEFGELMDLFLSNNTVLAQRAAWSISICGRANPGLALPHLPKMIKNLEKPGIHDAVKRNTVRLLEVVWLPKKHHGLVADACFKLFLNKKEAIAIRVFALTVLQNLALIYPEFANELVPLIEEEMTQNPKPAFVSRGKKALKILQKHKGISG
ncbi:MAG TPA: hypothetical protein VD905_12515 [Flavobacteriales bacterium]|nr:hypothetical protein [Flavobacteriales bacterium]